MNNILSMRTKGYYPVSIGTSIGLQTLFGTVSSTDLSNGVSANTHLSLNGKPPFYLYDCICINLRTVLRNFLSSMKAQEVLLVDSNELLVAFCQEVLLIDNIIQDQSQGDITVSYYLNSYKRIKSVLKRANIKTEFTAKQLVNNQIENSVIEKFLLSDIVVNRAVNVEITDNYINHGKIRNILFTHLPVDLLLVPWNNIDLLESHTGMIKPRYLFNTKLKGTADDVPFNKYSIQLLGDSSGMIQPVDKQVRKEVLKLAKERNFTNLTNQDRFLKELKEHGSTELVSLLNSMK